MRVPHFALVFSDVHLCVRADPARLASDRLLARTLDEARSTARRDGASLEVICNGDIIDFDVAPAGEPPQRCHDGVTAAARAEYVAAMRPAVFDALARVASEGHAVWFVAGNHDAQVALRAVRDVLHARVRGCGFRAWFHRTRDGAAHVEHGHLYDPLCALGRVLARDGRVEDSVGSVAARHAPVICGGIDPHMLDPFAAFAAAYLRGGGPLGSAAPGTYAAAVARAVIDLCAACERRDDDRRELCARAAAETGCDPARIAAQAGALCVGRASVADVLAEMRREGYGARTVARLRTAAASLAALHDVPAVVLGHSHTADGHRDARGAFLANAGTWTTRDDRPRGSFVWLESDGAGTLERAETRHVEAS